MCVRTAGSLAPSVAAAPASGPRGGTVQIKGWLGWGACVCVCEMMCGPTLWPEMNGGDFFVPAPVSFSFFFSP